MTRLMYQDDQIFQVAFIGAGIKNTVSTESRVREPSPPIEAIGWGAERFCRAASASLRVTVEPRAVSPGVQFAMGSCRDVLKSEPTSELYFRIGCAELF
jgi:hypothetical protein